MQLVQSIPNINVFYILIDVRTIVEKNITIVENCITTIENKGYLVIID